VSAVWTDSHCHVQGGDDPEATLKRAWDAGVTNIVCIGTDVDDSRRAIALAVGHVRPGDGCAAVFATVGLHPHDASAGVGGLSELLEEQLGEPRSDGAAPERQATARPIVVAVGECGLDYHYDHSPRNAQRDAFAAQVALARRHGLALVVHTREAWKDTFAVLAAEGVPDRLIFHCFSGDAAEAGTCLDAGGYLSFSGIITFKNADDLRAAAAVCPADRLLVETDSPFLTPVPHRGRPNEPMYTPLVGAAVAAARERPVEEIAELTSANSARVFGLPAPG
jgi:TatD DNase family protein